MGTCAKKRYIFGLSPNRSIGNIYQFETVYYRDAIEFHQFREDLIFFNDFAVVVMWYVCSSTINAVDMCTYIHPGHFLQNTLSIELNRFNEL